MNRVIRVDGEGVFSIDGQVLPGRVSSLSIGGKMVIDQAQMEGSSGKKKSFSGFDDSSISIGLVLAETVDGGKERYAKLRVLNGAFKALENSAPIVYALHGPLFEACDIRFCLFESLSTEDPADSDSLNASLKFVEHDPVVALVQNQQGNSGEVVEEIESPDAISSGVSLAEFRRFKGLEALHG